MDNFAKRNNAGEKPGQSIKSRTRARARAACLCLRIERYRISVKPTDVVHSGRECTRDGISRVPGSGRARALFRGISETTTRTTTMNSRDWEGALGGGVGGVRAETLARRKWWRGQDAAEPGLTFYCVFTYFRRIPARRFIKFNVFTRVGCTRRNGDVSRRHFIYIPLNFSRQRFSLGFRSARGSPLLFSPCVRE